MNSHKLDWNIDDLFTQAFDPLAEASPPRDTLFLLMRRIQAFPPRFHRLFTWLHGFSALIYLQSHQPVYTKACGKYQPSPFLSVTAGQFSGHRLAI